ncbi:PREDICTED: probable aminopeptidase NPEPL1 [Cyprinodon variegatus]|uniref:probable aminopeptidase NPEPL1 n=1 Tax=Cyprinodon variegatus TaxID=28743 RepID=UPI0007424FBA|nr:PREDICTED: probable aminopeptidase NPEPL1 [Cyprinodon variegatus]
MANVVLEFKVSAGDSEPQSRPVLILGQQNHLQDVCWSQIKGKLQPAVSKETWKAALGALNPNPTDSCPLYLNQAVVAALPSRVSRHNSPASAHFLFRLIRSCLPGGNNRCIVVVCERSDVFASACAIARAFPLFTRRSAASRRTEKKHVTVEFVVVDGSPLEDAEMGCLSNAADGVRLAARIVDTPCNEMNTDHFLDEIKAVGSDLGITPVIIRGEELKQRGFGGIYGVGKAAEHPPALAVLSHTPDGATQNIAWVGKGIVYDTGGLSIKGKTTMPGMKRDCGGAAAILGAFKATIKQVRQQPGGKSEFGGCFFQDRENAQSSCAGLFIGSHLGFDWPGVWVHVDIASPVHAGERATGFGVALLMALFGQASDDSMLNQVSPLGAPSNKSEGQMERDCKRRRLV